MMNNLPPDISKKILHVTEWIPLTDIPSMGHGKATYVSPKSNLFWRKTCIVESRSGVYQVSLTRPESFIHEDIGYIGKSKDLRKRVYNLACDSKPNNVSEHHKCGVYLRHSNINPADVYVRMFITKEKDISSIEKYLHGQQRSVHNHSIGYAWKEASGGPSSCRIAAQTAINRCDINTCIELRKYLEERIATLEKKEMTFQEAFFKLFE